MKIQRTFFCKYIIEFISLYKLNGQSLRSFNDYLYYFIEAEKVNISDNFNIDPYSNSDYYLHHPAFFIIFWVFIFLNKCNKNVAKNMQIIIFVADLFDVREITL